MTIGHAGERCMKAFRERQTVLLVHQVVGENECTAESRSTSGTPTPLAYSEQIVPILTEVGDQRAPEPLVVVDHQQHGRTIEVTRPPAATC